MSLGVAIKVLCLAQIHNRKNDWSCISGMHIIADLPTIEIVLARPTLGCFLEVS